MAQINKPNEYFNTVLYSGNGSTGHSITGVGFQPDWVWVKQRSGAEWHTLIDSVRGVTKYINSNDTSAERTSSNFIESFDSDGFTLGSANDTNQNSQTYASWNWLASNTTASNTDGSITSTVSANTTSGFSIVSYTGNGTAGATVGHGLGVAPSMIITKDRNSGGSGYWGVYHQSLGNTKALFLNLTNASGTNVAYWNNTSPTSSVFTLGDGSTSNVSGDNFIAYCFAEKKGFSKAFSYTGNGSSDGSFCYLGFRPAFILLKNADAVESWFIFDNLRQGYNPENEYLRPDLSNAEGTLNTIDILSNGFKIRNSGAYVNGSGNKFIGIAFAESPLVGTNNTPATAR